MVAATWGRHDKKLKTEWFQLTFELVFWILLMFSSLHIVLSEYVYLSSFSSIILDFSSLNFLSFDFLSHQHFLPSTSSCWIFCVFNILLFDHLSATLLGYITAKLFQRVLINIFSVLPQWQKKTKVKNTSRKMDNFKWTAQYAIHRQSICAFKTAQAFGPTANTRFSQGLVS